MTKKTKPQRIQTDGKKIPLIPKAPKKPKPKS